MTLKTCFRCDWQGETKKPGCPNCGTQPLYVVGVSPRKVEMAPARNDLDERSLEARGAVTIRPTDTASPVPRSPLPTDESGPAGRSARSTVAFVLGALLLIVVVTAWLNGQREPSPEPAAATSDAPSPTGNGSSIAVTPPPPKTETIGSPTKVGIGGRESLTVTGTRLSFSVPSRGWFRWGDLYITKSTIGPQGADAIIVWADVWRSNHARACGQWWGSPAASAAEVAAEASSKPGTELVTGPVGVTIGGYTAQHVVFTVRKEVACNPGFFHHWEAPIVGPFWSSMEVGDTVRIWLVDVGGKVLYIEADTHQRVGAHLREEIENIVASVAFD